MFKIGDTVEAIRDNWGVKQGDICRVVMVYPANMGVETERLSDGHNCDGLGKLGHCWWVDFDAYRPCNIDLENK